MAISYSLLWLTSIIWGLAFVAQSIGMEHLGPYGFNAVRFTLASLAMLPLLYFFERHQKRDIKLIIKAGSIAGIILFLGASLQQVGLMYTSPANAGFVTTMYIVIVPIMGIFLKHKVEPPTWVGIIVAVIGLYTLTIGPNLILQKGDTIELIGAFFWAAHVLVVGHYARKIPIISFSIAQLIVTAAFSWMIALIIEEPNWHSIQLSWIPLFYTGIASSAIAYTLQILGQKNIAPSSAALILSTEATFATIGGWLIMEDLLSLRELMGCVLIFIGIIISQYPKQKKSLLN